MKTTTSIPKCSAPWVCVIVLAGFSFGLEVIADPDAERQNLARLIHELDYLATLINVAEANVSSDARIRFRYDWLRKDLNRIRSGIQDHIDAPRSEPRSIPPLVGDYRQ